MNKPLITFALIAHNHEQFIKEAVKGAFAQTYSPLEIILSDDHSSDETLHIMRNLAATYKGPHLVVINANEANLGTAPAHVNRIMELAKGELIVIASGDDISIAERTQITYYAWEQSSRQAAMIHSRVIAVNERGEIIKGFHDYQGASRNSIYSKERLSLERYVRDLPVIYGCTCAWSPRVFSTFGPLPNGLVQEDCAIALRALAIGPIVFIDRPLVKYRLHSNNICFYVKRRLTDLESFDRHENRSKRVLGWNLILYKTFFSDLRMASEKGLLRTEECEPAMREIERKYKIDAFKLEMYGASFLRKFVLLFKLSQLGIHIRYLKQLAYRLIPYPIYRKAKVGTERWREMHSSYKKGFLSSVVFKSIRNKFGK